MVSGCSTHISTDELDTVTLEELTGAALLELGATLDELEAILDELTGAAELLMLDTATLDELSAVWLELESPGPATQAESATDVPSSKAERHCWKTACLTEESIMATLLSARVPSGKASRSCCWGHYLVNLCLNAIDSAKGTIIVY